MKLPRIIREFGMPNVVMTSTGVRYRDELKRKPLKHHLEHLTTESASQITRSEQETPQNHSKERI